jgi:uncharacterized damage-inducible protein DinB
MDRREFQDLLTHMEWADALTWKATRDLPAALTDERLKYLLHHMHLVQVVYLQAWRGDPFQMTELSAYADVAAVEAWTKPYYRRVVEFAQTIDQSRFAEPVDFPWSSMIAERYGTIVPATLAESAWQVFSHTTYHRGQVATRIRELGGEPPLVDFLVWVWSGRPAPDWI